jgi:hypothetical protein
MLAKTIYCSHCKTVTLQVPINDAQDQFKCHCETINQKPVHTGKPQDADAKGEDKNKKQNKD